MTRKLSASGLVAMLLLASCATIFKSPKATILFRDAPPDLVVLEGGHIVPLWNDGASKAGEISYKTTSLILQSGGRETTVGLTTTTGAGWVILDALCYLWPLLVDYGTGKWNSFDDVSALGALSRASVPAGGMPQMQAPPPPSVVQQAEPVAQRRATWSDTEAAPAAVAPPSQSRKAVFTEGKLAVLDFKNSAKEILPEQVRYFTDVVRDATVKATPKVHVMTRENLLVLLQASGKDIANCEGECEVDTGRRIGADAVVSGELLKVGTKLKLSLKLHETKDGTLLSTAVASGRSIDELDEAAQKAAIDLIAPMR
ncbi:MAG: hypothetical protein JST92_08890 [Deltaproteobacteria bacterium]|nr:hypothetical protein [Deltaproteobacteria bacterium]